MLSYIYGGFMKARDYFLQGNSCSESIVLEAIGNGLCDESLLPVATSFSGGMGSGCVCGAISGSQIVIGHLYGKNNKYNNLPMAKAIAKDFMERFKQSHKVTCCRILSKDFDLQSSERKQHCCNFVDFCSQILEELTTENVTNG